MRDVLLKNINNAIKEMNNSYNVNITYDENDNDESLLKLNNDLLLFEFFIKDIAELISSWVDIMEFRKSEFNINLDCIAYGNSLMKYCIDEAINKDFNYVSVISILTEKLNSVIDEYTPTTFQLILSNISSMMLPMSINLSIILIVYLIFFK